MYRRRTLDHIRKESASKAIYKTIQLVEEELGINIPKVGIPTIDRSAMIEVIRRRIT